ncbi:hypothetical protein [Nostoc sp.]|uniref:hypothetical protein n=1 Tax=Nostoc sp. TaxID=1180 RepID=UPI002FFA7B7B
MRSDQWQSSLCNSLPAVRKASRREGIAFSSCSKYLFYQRRSLLPQFRPREPKHLE